MYKSGKRRVRRALGVPLAVGTLGILAVPSAALPGPGSPPSTFTYLRSTNGGASFTPSQLAAASVEAEQTHVDAYGNTVHAIYDDLDPQPRRLFYRRSTNSGASFGPSVRLDVPQASFPGAVEVGDSGEADIAADANTVHVAWEDDRFLTSDFVVPVGIGGTNNLDGVRLRRDVMLADGAFWPAEQPGGNPEDDADNTVIPTGTVIPAGSLDPAADSNFFVLGDKRVARAQRQTNRDEVFYTQSTNNGASFPVGRNITNSPDVHDTDPDPDAEGSTVVIVHEGEDLVAPLDKSQLIDVWVLRSTDGGTTFSDINLTNAPGRQDEPSVALEGDDVTIVFRNEPTVPVGSLRRTAVVHSSNGGATFSAMVDLPNARPATAVHTTPHLLAQGSLVRVVTCENDDPNEDLDGDESFKLLQWTSTDGGASFPDQPAVLDSGPESCNKPHIDGAGSSVYVTYERDVHGQSDAFLVKSTNGGATYGTPRNVSADPHKSSDPIVSVNPTNPSQIHLSWNDASQFLFSLVYGQTLPLEDGDSFRFANEDVIRFVGGAYEMVLDGSDVGLRDFRIDALAELSPTQFLLSFTDAGKVPGISGTVDDSDVVLFSAVSVGNNTEGTFSLYFDGSDVGLTRSDEDVDALEVVNGDLYLSTTGDFSLTGGLKGNDEDIFRCNAPTTGPASACSSTALAFDGSAAGLTHSGEDIDAFAFDAVDPTAVDDEVPERQAFFSFTGAWDVPTASGGPSDLATCLLPKAALIVPDPVYDLPDCGSPNVAMHKLFIGETHLLAENINAIELEY